jgi:hypothetical protein
MPVQNKTERVLVRLTPLQAEKVRRRAEQEGERVSTWLRHIALREVRSHGQLQGQE